MKIRNPPIVEAWIEFHAQGSETEETWPSGLDRFFGEIAGEYPTIERQVQETYQVVERAPDGTPAQIAVQGELSRVRAFDGPRRHCVQVSRDTLVVNLLKGDGPYEGFDRLLPAAMGQFGRFVQVFRPRSIMWAALHYTDVVHIPRAPGAASRLEDYFRVGVQVPDDQTWVLGRIAVELSVSLSASPSEPDELVIAFRRQPPDPGVAEDRFRVDWHAICAQLDTLSSEVLRARLTKVHGALRARFRECFTDRAWALFGKESEA